MYLDPAAKRPPLHFQSYVMPIKYLFLAYFKKLLRCPYRVAVGAGVSCPTPGTGLGGFSAQVRVYGFLIESADFFTHIFTDFYTLLYSIRPFNPFTAGVLIKIVSILYC